MDQLLTAGPIHYQYDLRGNLVSATTSGQTAQYGYDAQNRLINTSLPDGTNITNTYDAYGRRAQQSINSQVTNYLWDEASPYGDVVLETGAGNTTSYVLAGSELLSQTRNGVTSYYLQDGQGSTRGLANSVGSVTDTYAYTAFGETLSHIGTTVNSYQYTGQQFDGLTGLYSLRARYYAPNIGRFLSQDTYAVNFSNPVELNRYGYTANNPVNFADPSGQTLTDYGVQTGQSARNSAGLSLLAKRILLPATIIAVFALWLVLTPTGPVVPDVTKPETSDEAADRYIREFYERYPQLDSSGGPSGLPKWAKILIAVLVGTQTGGDTVKVRPTPQPPQPTPTPQPPFIVRHFTSRNGLSAIRSHGYTIIPTYPAFPGQGAVFFTDTSPFNGGFDRYMISATLGIDYEKTESFIDIDRNKVGNQASWFSRLMNGRIEYYFLTNLPLTVVNGFIRDGDVSQLP